MNVATENFSDPNTGVGAFLSTKGDARRLFVYDPGLGVIESDGCTTQGRTFLAVDRVPGFKRVLIGLTCLDKASVSQGKTHFFEHLPGTREVRAIKTVSAQLNPVASHFYFDERGLDVWLSFDGEIWRSSPGTKDLRLWPPSHP
ncbi:MAG: hypothetical protein ACREMY_10465 [bacterium]